MKQENDGPCDLIATWPGDEAAGALAAACQDAWLEEQFETGQEAAGGPFPPREGHMSDGDATPAQWTHWPSLASIRRALAGMFQPSRATLTARFSGEGPEPRPEGHTGRWPQAFHLAGPQRPNPFPLRWTLREQAIEPTGQPTEGANQ